MAPNVFPLEDSSQLSRRFATKRCLLLASKVGSSILLRLAVGEEMCSPCWPSKKKGADKQDDVDKLGYGGSAVLKPR